MYYGSTLSHHGILGQKWGIRRFQTKSGALTPAGMKRYGGDGDDSSSGESGGHGGNARRYANADGSLTQEGVARLRAKRRGEVDDDFDADFEEVKKAVLNSGKASDVYELRGQISNKELQDAVARINWEKQLKNAAVADQKTVFDTIETIGKRAQTVSNAINSVDNLMTSAGKVLDRVDKITGSDRFKKIKDGIDAASEAKKAAKKVAEDIAKEADAKPKEKKGLFAKKDKEEKAEAKLEKEAEKSKAEDSKAEASKPADSGEKKSKYDPTRWADEKPVFGDDDTSSKSSSSSDRRFGPETEKAIAETKARKSADDGPTPAESAEARRKYREKLEASGDEAGLSRLRESEARETFRKESLSYRDKLADPSTTPAEAERAGREFESARRTYLDKTNSAARASSPGVTSRPGGTITVTRELGGTPKPAKEVNTRSRWPHAEFRKTESKAKTSSSSDDDDMWTAYESWTPKKESSSRTWGVRRKKK